MLMFRLRYAVRAALCTAVMITGLSCDALNPAFVNQLGGNASAIAPDLAGSIVVLFNNQRDVPLTLILSGELTRPGETAITLESESIYNRGGYAAMTYDCRTTAITILGILPGQVSATQPVDGGLSLATNEFRVPALQCGTVLFVNVPPFGSPTAELIN